MKKIFLFILTIIFLLFTQGVNAKYEIIGPDGESYDPNIDALRVTLVSDKGKILSTRSSSNTGEFTGHTFIELTNISGKQLNVASYTLKSNETITVGLFPKYNVCINYECYNKNSYYSNDCAKISCKLKEIHLDKLNQLLVKDYSYNALTFNCSHFATMIWNEISNLNINNLYLNILGLPDEVYKEILKFQISSIGYYYNTTYSYYYIENKILIKV